VSWVLPSFGLYFANGNLGGSSEFDGRHWLTLEGVGQRRFTTGGVLHPYNVVASPRSCKPSSSLVTLGPGADHGGGSAGGGRDERYNTGTGFPTVNVFAGTYGYGIPLTTVTRYRGVTVLG
jgi:hypothetical protein